MNSVTGSKEKLIISVHALVICLVFAFSYLAGIRLHADDLIRPYCFAQVVLLVWMFWSWKWLNGTLFDPYILFLLAAAMFHSGEVILECLNMNNGDFLSGLLPPEISVKVIFLVSISFALLHGGALLGVLKSKRSLRPPRVQEPVISKYVECIGWALFAVSVVPAVLTLKQIVGAAMSGGYFFALFARPSATGFAGMGSFFADFLIPSALFLLAGSRGKRLPLAVSAAVVAINSGVYLFVGSRTVAAVGVSVYAWLWDRLIRPLPRSLIAGTIAIGVFVIFPVIAITRDTGGGARLSLDYFKETWDKLQHPAAASLAETGGSLVTVGYTLELVPALRDFDMGGSYGMALFTLFPNLFWDRNPALAHGTPGTWMLDMVAPETAAAGGGLGYSFVAEAYYNFGWYGPLAIGLLGFALGRGVRWVKSYPDALRCVCIANSLLPLLWFTRNVASGAVRDVVWLGVGPYVLVRWFDSTQRYPKARPKRLGVIKASAAEHRHLSP